MAKSSETYPTISMKSDRIDIPDLTILYQYQRDESVLKPHDSSLEENDHILTGDKKRSSSNNTIFINIRDGMHFLPLFHSTNNDDHFGGVCTTNQPQHNPKKSLRTVL